MSYFNVKCQGNESFYDIVWSAMNFDSSAEWSASRDENPVCFSAKYDPFDIVHELGRLTDFTYLCESDLQDSVAVGYTHAGEARQIRLGKYLKSCTVYMALNDLIVNEGSFDATELDNEIKAFYRQDGNPALEAEIYREDRESFEFYYGKVEDTYDDFVIDI